MFQQIAWCYQGYPIKISPKLTQLPHLLLSPRTLRINFSFLVLSSLSCFSLPFLFLILTFFPPMFHLLSFILSSPLLHGVLCFMADSKRGRSFFCEWKWAPNELHCLSAPMVLELIFDAEISRWCKFSHSSRFAVCVCEWEMRNCAFVYVRARERGREESTCVSPNHSLLQCQPWPLISWLVGRQKQSPL